VSYFNVSIVSVIIALLCYMGLANSFMLQFYMYTVYLTISRTS